MFIFNIKILFLIKKYYICIEKKHTLNLKRSYFLFCCLIATCCTGALSLWKAGTLSIRSQAVYSPAAPLYYPEVNNFDHVKNITYRLSGDLYDNLSVGKKIFSVQHQVYGYSDFFKTLCSFIKLNDIKTWRTSAESSMPKNVIFGTTDTGSFFTDERCVNGFALIVKIPDKTIHSM